MTERWQEEPWAQDLWWSGKTTRRRFLGLSAATAAALGATMLVPAPWRKAFGQAKPYKVGIMQPLTGVAAAGGKTALVGSMMAIDRVSKLGKKWHIAYLDYAWGQSTRDAYAAEIKKLGGEVVGTTGIPLGTADMTSFLSKISGSFDGFFGIFFGANAVVLATQAYDLGLTKKYRFAGDGAVAESTHLPALGQKVEGFTGINRYIPVLDPPLNTPYHKRFYEDARARLKQIDPSGPDPDRYVQSNFEAINFLKLGMQKSGFRGREDTMKLIEALEGMEVKESDDFPQGDKTLRKQDHQAFIREFIFDIKNT